MNKQKGLTPRQRQAIQALLISPTIKAAAASAKVSPRTLRRWLKENITFREELAAHQSAAVGQTLFRLADATGEALTVTRAVMLTPSVGLSTRLRAAEVILGKLLPLKDAQ